ncbi:hypothetical protein B4N89_27740 [Embleya scabrispora]|uniref:Uncharacterized protein n=1 Tax=Embleya scabrispora TaxID=159449 RepID=A0A1T3P563_9ACTN|nr:hypothetical protein [Embleya scabrispora]OPC84216.1 hypothetical protein B4N89_27740 [Embleya scabrispora]
MTDTATRRIRCRIPYAVHLYPDGMPAALIEDLARKSFARSGITLPEHPSLEVHTADEDELAIMFLGRTHEGLGAHVVEYTTNRTEQQ